MRPALSIVLPAYNEEENVERAVGTASATAQALVEDYEVLVVDDGSWDSTARRLAGLQAELGSRLRVVRHPSNQGYGAALRDGFGAATGDLVFYTDSDNQFDLSELADFLPLMKEADVAVGYRRGPQHTLFPQQSSSLFHPLPAPALPPPLPQPAPPF